MKLVMIPMAMISAYFSWYVSNIPWQSKSNPRGLSYKQEIMKRKIRRAGGLDVIQFPIKERDEIITL